jgi:two-component sensor histidine kinase
MPFFTQFIFSRSRAYTRTIGRIFLFFTLLLYAGPISAQYIDRNQENMLMKKLAQSSSDTNRIQTLVLLGKFHTYKEGKKQKDLDSAYNYLSWARKLSDTLNIQYFQHQTESMIVTFLLNKGDLKSAEARYDLLMKDCDRTRDLQCKADAMFRHAIFYSSADTNYEVAKREYTECARIYHQLNEHNEEERQHYELAFVHFKEDKLDLTITELLEVVKKAKAAKFERLPETYTLLSKVYRVKGDFNNGLKYAILATEAIKVAKKKRGERYYYDDLARMYQEIGENKQALIWYDRAVTLWRKEGLPEYGMYLAQGHLIMELIAKKEANQALYEVKKLEKEIPPVTTIQKAVVAQNLAICYNGLKQYSLAEKYFLSAEDLYKHSVMDFEGPQESYPQIARFYLEQKQYKRANYYLQQSLNFKPQRLSIAAIRDVHYMLFKVDSAEKNYISAIDHQRIGKHWDDSLLNRSKLYEIVRLQVQFKTKELAEGYQNQTKFQIIKLQQVRQTQNMFIGFACVLFIIIILLLNQYRIKQSSNKQLRAKQIEIGNQNVKLQNLVQEKEWLVKEIHHRVKNNLQTIVSLLESQIGFLNDADALAAVKNSQHRIHAMSLIHQKLYLTDNLTSVNMAIYVKELVNYLSESFNTAKNIIFDLEVSPLDIDVAIAIPLGLILNETITNSIKYAFKEKGGTVCVKFIREDSLYKLTIADNGIGLPAGLTDTGAIASLGMTLIKGLCKQIGADFNINGDAGVIISITFKPVLFNKDKR